MWERVDYDVPGELAAVTTSVWEYSSILIVGVMRPVMLAPPVLWAHIFKSGVYNVRRGREMLDDLQVIINSPLVYAEGEVARPRNKALLNYLGFIEKATDNERTLYSRSI